MKEFEFKGLAISGFLAIGIQAAIVAVIIILGKYLQSEAWALVIDIILGILGGLITAGYFQLEPNESRVMVFFGKYKGTFSKTGFFWVNPFYSKKKLSMRARNMDIEPIKVNDKSGNPVMVGMVLVWKLKDTYKAMFEIDSQTMADVTAGKSSVSSVMNAFENFVNIQSNAALREVASNYNYDNNQGNEDETTLRSGGEEVNEILEKSLNNRLEMAGIEVLEARINYLAYAPEIAAVMLRKQQASAVIAAREKIVEGAVSMVKMALDKLDTDKTVELDNEKKAAMVSNLLVVLCADETAQPVINAGTLYQ